MGVEHIVKTNISILGSHNPLWRNLNLNAMINRCILKTILREAQVVLLTWTTFQLQQHFFALISSENVYDKNVMNSIFMNFGRHIGRKSYDQYLAKRKKTNDISGFRF